MATGPDATRVHPHRSYRCKFASEWMPTLQHQHQQQQKSDTKTSQYSPIHSELEGEGGEGGGVSRLIYNPILISVYLAIFTIDIRSIPEAFNIKKKYRYNTEIYYEAEKEIGAGAIINRLRAPGIAPAARLPGRPTPGRNPISNLATCCPIIGRLISRLCKSSAITAGRKDH